MCVQLWSRWRCPQPQQRKPTGKGSTSTCMIHWGHLLTRKGSPQEGIFVYLRRLNAREKTKQVVRDDAYDCIDNIGEHDVHQVLGTHLRNKPSVEAEPWSALREGTEPIHSDTTTKRLELKDRKDDDEEEEGYSEASHQSNYALSLKLFLLVYSRRVVSSNSRGITRRGCVTDDSPGFLLSLIANESMS